MDNRITIVGASVRAAAQSARRAGFTPVAGDQFGDVDLVACAAETTVCDYPPGLQGVVRHSPGPWMYTGGLENHPRLVDAMAELNPLWGISGASLRQSRNPEAVATALGAAGLAAPEIVRGAETLSRDGAWLRKGRHSAAGGEVARWDSVPGNGIHELTLPDARYYFQRRVAGTPAAAVFVAARGGARLIGATRQLVGADWSGPRTYSYAGSIGPLTLTPVVTAKLRAVGDCLANAFDLVGLFGVDFMLDGDEVWPVEINPRYTASVEILERGLGMRAIALHAAACRDGELAESTPEAGPGRHGKAIVFAERDLVISAELAALVEHENTGREWPRFADVPAVGAEIKTGWPILTVFAEGIDEREAEVGLRAQATTVRWALTPE